MMGGGDSSVENRNCADVARTIGPALSMRILLNILIALTLIGIGVVVVMSRQADGVKQDQIKSTKEEVRRFQRQITLQSTLADIELTSEGFPVTIDPLWFDGHLPANTLLEVGRPWVQIAGLDERASLHPIDLAARDAAAAQFWYSPYKGIVRARVPADISDKRALTIYNQVNGSRLADMFSRIDPER